MGVAAIPAGADIQLDRFRSALSAGGFEGDLETGLGAREVASTDNSIYQVRPRAIVYPRCASDINIIVRAALADRDAPLALCPRGGNTGTNGQSLSAGVIVDFARYMNTIISIDVDSTGGTVVVEPGVVLDQLNAALSRHGLFFPPMVSTASRATIGGMVATDASGKGSRRYGKTSDYVEALDVVLSNGQDWRVLPMTRAEADAISRHDDHVGRIHREAVRIVVENADEIARVFPDMNRGLTGYNLQKAFDAERDRFFLAPLLAGSEGTLALTKSVRLRVVPKPAVKILAVVRYDSFDGGLRDVERLLGSDPVAIEILDDKVLEVAQTDIIWNGISAILGDDTRAPVRAISFIEFAGDPAKVDADLERLADLMGGAPAAQLDWKVVRDTGLIYRLWGLREKAVGLLARLGGGRQGVPFVEDTAVPPRQLADYVAEFRALLDRHGLKYGMFGHADVGCLHVRPFLDLKDPDQAALIRPISDGVAALTKSYGGLLWGEHGRGYRGEYSPFFFGPKLYPELERLKQAFDPANIFNPGKLASADRAAPVDRIDSVPFRGSLDRKITMKLVRDFDRAIACNGNGACFSWDALDVMCPSYKATRDRAQSPKGRAALLRTWARMASQPPTAEFAEVEAATARSLSTCLSCKACTTLCPVKVDVPTMKSRFGERYYTTRARPLRHRLLAHMEGMLAPGRAAPAVVNLFLKSAPVARLLETVAGFVDLPRFAPARRSRLPALADHGSLQHASEAERQRTVILVEDTFTSTFEGGLLEAATELLCALGYQVRRLPARPNGKALHVLGFRQAFAGIARRRVDEVSRYQALGVRLVGLDSATALMYEHEYREFANGDVRVVGLEAVLAEDIDAHRLTPRPVRAAQPYQILGHCTEQALRPQSAPAWQAIFSHFGMHAVPTRTGCCGMAGMFGHEREHRAISKRLFDLSWRDALGEQPDGVLATGFSCRCQVKRFAGFRPRHPIEALRDAICKQSTQTLAPCP